MSAANRGTGTGAEDTAAPSPAPGTGDTTPAPEDSEDRGRGILKSIVTGSSLVAILAVVLSIILGGILIALTDEDVAAAASYFFTRPTDTLAAAWEAASSAYVALFQGAVFNPRADSLALMFRPLTETFTVATPLILAGLGVAVAFRAGLFNIGAQGQIILGAMFAGWIGFTWQLPFGLHLIFVVLAGFVGGALWGFIPGILKARTGAHEVIVTIMLNYIAIYLVGYLLTTPSFQNPGSANPISPRLDETALFPQILGPQFRLHLGFIVAIAATYGVWWLLNRSTVGFELRAVGANPFAARTAGISVTKGYVVVMMLAGGLAGLAGVAQVAGTEQVLTSGIAASFGFDAITVALLGRSHPWGVFFAGVLFGAFRAGGVQMQTLTGTPIDIVLVVQSLIVLFIAAPPLVKAIFRIDRKKKSPRKQKGNQNQMTSGGAA
ncbi:ABC transporter permease [Arthrobacter tumbae]|uniref:ABC transporter permease n=1 Tax=Arthrobacter tumbae TaxID=163874 RepID=UPI001959E391|nr:ABC transporter permease [Arthrobacter tumbae]MBM7782441.1 simple sugar transport system permease protein [Arthrobacter tumbae]